MLGTSEPINEPISQIRKPRLRVITQQGEEENTKTLGPPAFSSYLEIAEPQLVYGDPDHTHLFKTVCKAGLSLWAEGPSLPYLGCRW